MPASRTARPELAGSLVVVGLTVALALWALFGEQRTSSSDGPDYTALPLALAFAYGGTAAVLAARGAAPVVRRVLLAIAATQAVCALAAAYADVALAESWPLDETALWLSVWLWSPAYVAVPVLLPLVLPDGRPVWRWSPWLAGAAVVLTAASWALTPYPEMDVPVLGYDNPVGQSWVLHPAAHVISIGAVLAGVAVALASMVVRWRRATGVARDQLRWLLVGVLGTVAVGSLAFITPVWGAELFPALAALPFPAACLVALLRHRLWDVDVVLSRSLSYALLSAAVVGGYVVAVALLGASLGSTADAPLLATALVALLVLPLHSRLQRLVNRLVHGDADDPYTALSRLGDRLEASADPGELAGRVLPDLVAQVARVLRVPHVAVVLADGSRCEAGTQSASATDTPLLYGGVEVGRLVVSGAARPRAEQRLLDHLSRQAAVAVHAVLLARDAQQARATTATAREEERRRLRRDLHDGVGPALAAVALQTETARDLVLTDPEAAVAMLDRLVPRLNDAVHDVRTLAHDLRPPTLDELGLAGSVRELATRFATPSRTVSVDTGELTTLPAAVDLAAYRIVAESLTNAARHASATSVRLALACSPSALEVRICDDGSGLAPDSVAGVGLRSMREQAEELGGSCDVSVGPDGRGTTVVATLPLQRQA